MDAADSSALPAFRLFMSFFAPITFAALVVVAVSSARARQKHKRLSLTD
jgi:hypothetical protein